MLTVSLHGIRIHAPHGLYWQEKMLGNEFEVDVDVWLNDRGNEWPFADYVIINKIVNEAFLHQAELLEVFVKEIHTNLKHQLPQVEKVRVAVKKLRPPMNGDVKYAQVVYEN